MACVSRLVLILARSLPEESPGASEWREPSAEPPSLMRELFAFRRYRDRLAPLFRETGAPAWGHAGLP